MMDLTDDYENGKYIPDAESYRTTWPKLAAAFREGLAERQNLDVPYGIKERNKLDLFLPPERPAGLLVFVHGGYWRMLDKSMWSHLANGAIERGWAVAMPSYTLAPAARISEMTQEIATSISLAAEMVPEVPVVVTGHSAGGHLTARMGCKDVALSAVVEARLKRLVPISPLADLRPLMQTDMNQDLQLEEAEALSESPALCQSIRDVPTVCWVGSEERPAFLDQARWLEAAWPNCELRIASGRHHLDVIDGLAQPDSSLMRSALDGL